MVRGLNYLVLRDERLESAGKTGHVLECNLGADVPSWRTCFHLAFIERGIGTQRGSAEQFERTGVRTNVKNDLDLARFDLYDTNLYS